MADRCIPTLKGPVSFGFGIVSIVLVWELSVKILNLLTDTS